MVQIRKENDDLEGIDLVYLAMYRTAPGRAYVAYERGVPEFRELLSLIGLPRISTGLDQLRDCNNEGCLTHLGNA